MVWVEQTDPSSGRSFFANAETGETTWIRPADMVSWFAKLDPNSGNTFYVSSAGETVWTLPEGATLTEGTTEGTTRGTPKPS